MQWREETLEGAGARLHVRRVVDPVAPPILLLHGLGVAGSIWQSFARRLLPHLAAVAPDLRGHGQSDAPAAGYLPADYARDLVQIVQAELEAPLAVVGHSLGALVALSMAELQPESIGWLVLLDPPLDPELRNPEVPSVYRLRHAPAGELEAYLLRHNPGGGALLAQSLARLFRQASDAAFEAMLEGDDPADRPRRMIAVDAAHTAVRIPQPVLLLQADPEHGGVLGDSAARAFVQRLPHGKLIKISGGTHALHASAAGPVARAILEFGGYSSGESSAS